MRANPFSRAEAQYVLAQVQAAYADVLSENPDQTLESCLLSFDDSSEISGHVKFVSQLGTSPGTYRWLRLELYRPLSMQSAGFSHLWVFTPPRLVGGRLGAKPCA